MAIPGVWGVPAVNCAGTVGFLVGISLVAAFLGRQLVRASGEPASAGAPASLLHSILLLPRLLREAPCGELHLILF